MKKLLFLLLFQYCCTQSFSQVIRKYPIGKSGCSAYLYCDPGTFDSSYSEDSSKIYTAECKNEETGYGIICVQLKEPVTDISTAEELLIKYLDFLKSSFKITEAAGYGKGHRLRGKENIHGIIDYWKDEEKNNWKVKGWTDGNFIAVLYAYSKKDIPETKLNLFLDGIVLKGM